MARNERRRTQREAVPLGEDRPVQLTSDRRFYSAQGNEGPMRTARALTQAFGAGTELYEKIIDRRNEAGAAQAAQEAAKGQDRDITNANKGYVETYDRIEAANDLALFSRELPQMLDEMDWSNLSPEEVQAQIDGYYKNQLQGIDPTSVYGKQVAEGILKQNALLLDTHAKAVYEKNQQEARSLLFGAVRTAYDATGTIDHAQLMEDTKNLFEGSDRRTVYLESVIDLAEEMGDVSLIESMPERFPDGSLTGITDPRMKDVFDKAKQNARLKREQMDKERNDKFYAEKQTELAQLHSEDKRLADAGNPIVLGRIAEGGQDGPDGFPPRRYSEAQQTALYDRYFAARESAGLIENAARMFASGNFIGGTQAEYDGGYNAFIEMAAAALPEDMPEEQKQATLVTLGIERSVVNGRLPSVLKDALSVNVNNPAKFAEAAELYEQFEAQLPGFVESQIDNKQSRLLDVYGRVLQDAGGDEKRAIEILKAYQPGRHSAYPSKVIDEAVDTAIETIDDKPWSLSNYSETVRTRRLMKENVQFYVDMGYEPEVAARYAFEHASRRMIRVGGELYNRDEGWGQNPELTHEWAVNNEAAHRGVDPDTLKIVPTNTPGLVVFQQEGEILPSITTYRVSELTAGYQRSGRERAEQQELQWLNELPDADRQKRLQEAEVRAYRKMYPAITYGPGADTLDLQSLQRWEQLDPAKRDALIRAELKP